MCDLVAHFSNLNNSNNDQNIVFNKFDMDKSNV